MYRQFLADGLSTIEHGRHFLKTPWWLYWSKKLIYSPAVQWFHVVYPASTLRTWYFPSLQLMQPSSSTSNPQTIPHQAEEKQKSCVWKTPQIYPCMYMYALLSIKSKLLDNGNAFFVCLFLWTEMKPWSITKKTRPITGLVQIFGCKNNI